MKILTIGGATRDIFIEHEVITSKINNISYLMFPEGKKVEVSAIRYAAGGGATNSAVAFKQLGFDVTSFFKVGTDHEAQMILKELATYGINSHHVAQTNLAATGTSFILPSASGDRAILVYRGANALLTAADAPKDLLAQVNQLYITSLSGNASELLPHLAALAKKNNIPVACNPGTSQLTSRVDTLERALEHIDILILNSYEASLLWQKECPSSHSIDSGKARSEAFQNSVRADALEAQNSKSLLHQYFKTILARGPRIAVITDGANGVYVCDGTNIYYHPSIPCNPISSVGAGDAFGSTFVAFLAQNRSIQEATQAGVINAASVLMHLDAKAGLLTQAQINKQQEKLDPSLLQIFDF